jgi:uncharacterized protein YukE
MIEQDLLDLKKEITDAKEEVAGLKGQQTALMKQLKDDWKCNSIEEAEKKIAQMEEAVEKLQDQIDEGVEELQEKYGIE